MGREQLTPREHWEQCFRDCDLELINVHKTLDHSRLQVQRALEVIGELEDRSLLLQGRKQAMKLAIAMAEAGDGIVSVQ